MNGNRRYHILAKNILIYRELQPVLCVLVEKQIPVIVLKGGALAKTVYPDLSYRPMGDVDLCVHLEDREKVSEILDALGFQRKVKAMQKFSPFDTQFTGEISFSNKNGVMIDLHWEITPSEWFRRLTHIDMQSLWESAQPLLLDGTQVLQLSPVDTLIYLCLHLTMHQYTHLVGYTDLYWVIQHNDPFPWDQFLERVKSFQLSTTCYFPLLVVYSQLHAPIPDNVLKILQPSNWKRQLINRIANPVLGFQGRLSFSRSRSYVVQIMATEHLSALMSVFLWLIFPGSSWLRERYRLKSKIDSLFACFWHPFIVAGYGLQSIWELIRM